MNILNDIPELIKANVISQETADKIQSYYQSKGSNSGNRLLIVFGILGAILFGLGIILILAHNWDDLSRITKTNLAFIPLVAAQILCGFVLFMKRDSVAWRESTTVFLFFAVGTCISLISQIYNIPGNMSSFLMTWMLLCIPLIYIMKSSVTSLFCLIGITLYACETQYWNSYTDSFPYTYWILLLILLPHYYLLNKKNPESNFVNFHNWLIPISVIITLGTITKENGDLMYIAYMSLFGLLYLTGNSKFFHDAKLQSNSFKILGTLGTMVLLFMLSFNWFWDELKEDDFLIRYIIFSPEFIFSVIIISAAIVFLFMAIKRKPFYIYPLEIVFIIFIGIFIIGIYSTIAVVLINILIFIIGLLTMRNGVKVNRLGILNFGLIIIMTLVICRFFDTDLSFILRGFLFLLVGVGFFVANLIMLKKRKSIKK